MDYTNLAALTADPNSYLNYTHHIARRISLTESIEIASETDNSAKLIIMLSI